VNDIHRPQRAERIIATARAILAVFVSLGVWLEPAAASRYIPGTHALLLGYMAYALALLALVWLRAPAGARFGVSTHVVDLAMFTIFVSAAEGPTGPLYVYFVFALMAGALRWGRRGVLWTVAPTLTAFIALGVYEHVFLRGPLLGVDRFVIRIGYLGIVALLLVYLTSYEERLHSELARLAAWPRAARAEAPLSEALPHAAELMGAPRALVTWEERETSIRHLAVFADGEVAIVCEAELEPLVAEPLAEADFLCGDLRTPLPIVVYTSHDGLRRLQVAPLAPELVCRFDIRKSVLGLQLRGALVKGRLLILDATVDVDALVLGGIIARQLSADLDQFYLQRSLQQAAVADERIRFARELHDGLLQALTGVGLQLRLLQRLVESDPDAVRERLADLQNLVAAEQRDLRYFVEQITSMPLAGADAGAGVTARLEELARRAERAWNLTVDLQVAPLARTLPEALAHALARLVQEALANSARHGGARRVRVTVGAHQGGIRCTVVDDGKGFPFRGRRDLAALSREQIGPVSLRERVAALGGELVIDSSELGARLEITLPLGPPSNDSIPIRSGTPEGA
jgi:signal transduction histidine kinase